MSALAFVKFFHLIGLVVGFGCALLADLLILRNGILKPVSRQLTDWLVYVSRFAFAGLALLWISGIALIGVRYLQDPAILMNQKLWAKIVIVVLLSINGFFVHHFALKAIGESVGRRLFDGRSRTEILCFTMVAAVSSVSWVLPAYLGVAPELNHKVSVGAVLSVYAVLIMLAWLGMFVLVTQILPYFYVPVRPVEVLVKSPSQVIAVAPVVPMQIERPLDQDELHQKYLELLKRVRSMSPSA